jgi:predicted transcriptional regulator
MVHKPKKFIRTSLTLDPDDHASILEMAEKTETSASWLIRQAIRGFLEEYNEKGQPKLPFKMGLKE